MLEDSDPSPSAGRRRQIGSTTEAGAIVRAPSGFRIVEVKTESSQALRDLASYRRDIELVTTFLESLLERGVESLREPRSPNQALWIAAITMYGRAFKSGVRLSERPDTSSFSKKQLEKHEYFLNLRDKHIAHAVNDYEDTAVIAYLTDSSFMKPAVTRTGQTHTEWLPADESDVMLLLTLCEQLLKNLNKRIRRLHRVLGEELHELGLERVYAFPDATIPDHNEANVAKRRK